MNQIPCWECQHTYGIFLGRSSHRELNSWPTVSAAHWSSENKHSVVRVSLPCVMRFGCVHDLFKASFSWSCFLFFYFVFYPSSWNCLHGSEKGQRVEKMDQWQEIDKQAARCELQKKNRTAKTYQKYIRISECHTQSVCMCNILLHMKPDV